MYELKVHEVTRESLIALIDEAQQRSRRHRADAAKLADRVIAQLVTLSRIKEVVPGHMTVYAQWCESRYLDVVTTVAELQFGVISVSRKKPRESYRSGSLHFSVHER